MDDGPAAVHNHVCVVLLNNFNSAKDQKAPQTRNILLRNNGLCRWTQFFPSSVSHCSIDTTWFPFDKQSCNLMYQSWKFSSATLILYPRGRLSNSSVGTILKYEFVENDLWEIIGTCILRIMHYLSCALVYFGSDTGRPNEVYIVHLEGHT